jgi:hypothetical protein
VTPLTSSPHLLTPYDALRELRQRSIKKPRRLYYIRRPAKRRQKTNQNIIRKKINKKHVRQRLGEEFNCQVLLRCLSPASVPHCDFNGAPEPSSIDITMLDQVQCEPLDLRMPKQTS